MRPSPSTASEVEWARTVHVLIPHHRRRSSSGYVTVERTRRLPLAVMRGRKPARPWCGAQSTRLAPPKTSTNAGPCSRKSCSGVTRRSKNSRSNLPRVRSAAAQCHDRYWASSAGTHTRRPRSTRNGCMREVDCRPGVQPRSRGRRGKLRGTSRRVARDVGLAWEIDSLRHHLSVPDHEATVRRRANYDRRGAIVVETLPRDLDLDPDGVIAELREAIAPRSNARVHRPTPPQH